MSDRLKDEFKRLLGAGLTQAECLVILAEHGNKYPEYASQVETDDELEVDDHPLYSYTDEGVWVSAWVWVPHTSVEDEEEVVIFSAEGFRRP